MGLLVKDDGWRVPDRVWARMRPLLPEPPSHPLGCHNPRVPDRAAMDAILLVLRTGMQWNALDATGICSCSSAYRRFREWAEAGVFLEFWRQGLCLDRGYDNHEVRDLCQEFGFTAHIRGRRDEAQALKHEAGFRARRWVVERSHSWLNRFRRILTRWEKRADTYLAMLHLACGLITWRANDTPPLPK